LERFGESRYDFSDEDYLGLDKKCPHTCRKCGNTFDAIPNNVLTAHGSSSHYCPHCNNMVRDERPYRERCLEATEGRVEPLGVYVNRKTQLLHRCTTCGHSWECTPSNPLSGTGCPKCSRRIKESVGEMAVADLFRRAGLRVLTKDHSVLRRRELDVYLPDLALAVEYNGLFWHGERYKDSGYHLEKLEECRAAGVRLIQIFEDEWLLRREIVEEKLLVTAGAFSGRRINARECTVEEVGVSEKNALLEASHVQGADKSLLNLGLRTTTGELVAVMTLCARRAALGGKAQDGDVELSRYASLIGTSVRGGFGKLLAHLRRGYEFETITTYADRRWSDGAVYERSGFVLNHASAPNYWYIHRNNGERRLHRYGFRKQRLAKLFPDLYEESRTEREIMAEAGYFRVWDCGSLVFRYDNPGP
jgi:predicted  nucleic acid-binding Zn-ribbon protein